jgi:site-specific DNA recombinase
MSNLWNSTAGVALRVVLYARYSSDMQSPTSIEDQFRICREYAEKQGWKVVGTYADPAKSGTSLLQRRQLLKLLEDAKRGKFDIVLAEALDRLSRDQADMPTIFKRLKFAEVMLVTLEDNEVTPMHIGLKGTMNQQFIATLGAKVHRGIVGRVLEGTVVQLPYGYELDRRFKDDGITVIKGERKINEVEAEIIRRIFREYAAGISPIEIARRLNAEEIPSPKGKKWSDASLRGHPWNGTGILNNPLYHGKLVWNRTRKVRNPDTGTEVSRLNPPEKWITVDIPKLRIVDDELWHAVKARQDAIIEKYSKQIEGVRDYHRANRGALLSATHRPRTPLSGLLWCEVCGGRYHRRGQDYYGCSNHLFGAGCSNQRIVARGPLEDRVLAGLRDLLIDPKIMADAMRGYADEMNRLNRERTGSRGEKAKLLGQIQGKVKEITLAIEDGGYSRALGDRLRELEARRDELEAQLAPVPVTEALPPVEEFLRRVEHLTETLRNPEISEEAWDVIRGLIDRITILPDLEKRGRFSLTLHGDLAAMIGQPNIAPGDLHFQCRLDARSHHPHPRTAEHREKISKASKGRIPWNKGLGGTPAWNKGQKNALGAENGRKGAEKMRLIATGRKRQYRPDGTWTWVYPDKSAA